MLDICGHVDVPLMAAATMNVPIVPSAHLASCAHDATSMCVFRGLEEMVSKA